MSGISGVCTYVLHTHDKYPPPSVWTIQGRVLCIVVLQVMLLRGQGTVHPQNKGGGSGGGKMRGRSFFFSLSLSLFF